MQAALRDYLVCTGDLPYAVGMVLMDVLCKTTGQEFLKQNVCTIKRVQLKHLLVC